MMTRKSLIYMLLSIVLAVYLAAALVVSFNMSAEEVAGPIAVEISGNDNGFITSDVVMSELSRSGLDDVRGMRLADVNLDAIESHLNAIDNIETATVYRTFRGNNSRIMVSVAPMQPVVRVFDNGKSYYINHSGKRLTANSRYHVDVPVVIGSFDSIFMAKNVLPIIDYLDTDPNFAEFVTAIEVNKARDIILYPAHTGPVINFGDATLIKNKIHRIMRIYQDVIPVKGYEYYDTLSVKWAGQVVATRHRKTPPSPGILFDTETDPAEIDLGYLDTIPLHRDQISQNNKPKP